ncbi:right-handed parallel beta-helix repeat-containing protein [Streptomyces sp. NPDC051940]|uniref:right-handed parallel beta-helix repeat-containing protein n=1 Tax=Streptomyces sp. NPDC051940 TaxID=3155675 RepID=UPI0034202F29
MDSRYSAMRRRDLQTPRRKQTQRRRRRWTRGAGALLAAAVLWGGAALPGAASDDGAAGRAPGTRHAAPDDGALIAWVGPTRPPTLMTLQAALTAAADGDTVNVLDGNYVFANTLTVTSRVTLTAAGSAQLTALLSVTGGGLTTTNTTLAPTASAKAVVTATASGAELTGLTVVNPANLASVTGILLSGTTTATTITGFGFDNGDNAANGTSQGINAANATGVVVDGADISGVTRGFTMTAARTGTGPRLSDSTIEATTLGVHTGATTGATFDQVTVTGTSHAASYGVNLAGSTGVVMTDVTVTGYQYGIATAGATTGTGPQLTGVTVKEITTTGISLGATTGAALTRVTAEGTSASPSTGIQLAGSSGVVIDNPVVSDFATGIGATWVAAAGQTRTGPTVTGGRIERCSSGLGAANTTGMTVRGTTIALTPGASGKGGTGIAGHEVAQATVENVSIDGVSYEPMPSGGSNAIRFYYSDGVTVRDVTLTEGATGFYWDMTSDVTVTRATVREMDWYATYTESVTGLTVTDSTFEDNEGVANLTINPSSSANGLNRIQNSSDVTFADNVLTDNPFGVYIPYGSHDVRYLRNKVAGGPADFVLLLSPAHDVLIEDNDIAFTPRTDSAAAVKVTTLYENLDPATYPNTPEDQQSRSSSDIGMLGNTFTGSGPMLQLGAPASPTRAAVSDWRVMRDTVEVSGNTFPRDSVAIRTYPNAEQGQDAYPGNDMIGGNTAADARDGGSRGPNDWGRPCGPRVTAGGTQSSADPMIYNAGGAWIHETREPQVLYPTRCAEANLTLTQTPPQPSPARPGDEATFTLVPHNDGPAEAGAGWTVTVVLPEGLELISMAGPEYTSDGATATGGAPLEAGTDGPVLTVRVRVTATTATELHNVAYITPAPGDVPESNPLVVPDLTTDPDTSATDNDAQGYLLVSPVEPTPTPTPPTPTPTPPTPTPDPHPTDDHHALPDTGSTPWAPLLAVVGAGLLVSAGLVLTAYRNRRRVRR